MRCECSTIVSWPFAFLFLTFIAIRPINSSRERNLVKTYDVLKTCKSGSKIEINLGVGAAVFVFNETQAPGQNILGDFACHYELEVSSFKSQYFMHVYIDQMDFLENPVKSQEQPCQDFVQFGRDILFVTTNKSPPYCGTRSKVEPRKATNGSLVPGFTGGQGSRMFVEENDSEMDVWIRVSKKNQQLHPRPRILVMTVTVIKKCESSDHWYRKCPHSRGYCIRREFFCDGRVNCAWPDAEAGGTDEVLCDVEDTAYTGPFNTRGASNVLLIVVLIIISIAFIVFTLIFGKKFVVMFCKENNLPRNNSPSPPSNELFRINRRDNRRPYEPSEETPALINQVNIEEIPDENLPTAPPSYEDVIKDNPGILAGGVPTAPPSYTESCSATTTQV